MSSATATASAAPAATGGGGGAGGGAGAGDGDASTTAAITASQWVYTKRPEGAVSREHYTLKHDVALPALKDGDILVRTLFCSVDPYMRIQQAASSTWEKPFPLGKPQGGGVVGQVVESKDSTGRVKKGAIVNVYTGWQTYAVTTAASAVLVDFKGVPISAALGVLGMPARTAYFGLLEAGEPKAGETVVVSGAAGAVGSIVAQIARIKGARVIGIAGGATKCAYLCDELGCAGAIDYKKHTTPEAMVAALQAACPDGVDVYFDNVGGMICDSMFHVLNTNGRVIICGQISQYNGGLDNPELGPRFLHHVLYKRLRIQGILARDFTPRHGEMVAAVSAWIAEGALKFRETVVEGFDKLPDALASLFKGANTGKLVVKVADVESS